MKILIFYQYFTTPKGSWGTRVYEFAKDWVAEGHEVTVISAIYSKSDLKAVKLVESQSFEGISVKVINVEVDNKQPIYKRILTFVYYALISSFYAIFKRSDVVIASSGPITVGVPGLLSVLFRNGKFVYEVRDLWPEVAIELGVIKNNFIKKLAFFLEKTLYSKAKLVIGLSPGMRDFVVNNFNHSNTISITNACNLELFNKNFPFPARSILKEDDTYAIYTGNIGRVNNSYWLLNTARYLKGIGRRDIKIVLAGDGLQREELCEIAARENLDNFVYLGLIPKEKIVAYLKKSLVSLVPLAANPILDTSSPNKLFESLAAGIPVIQTTNGWIKDYLEENKVGFTVSGKSEKELGDLLIKLSGSESIISEMSKRAYQCACQDFDQKFLAKKYLNSLKKLI